MDKSKNGEKKSKKKMAVWKKTLIILLVLLLLLFGSVFAITWSTLSRINRVNPNATTSEEFTGDEFDPDVDASEDTMNPEDVKWADEEDWYNRLLGLDPDSMTPEERALWDSLTDEQRALLEARRLQEANVVNILLIGQDRRPGQGRQRSDSMMILSINKRDKTITITSLMRDMYVQIPGYQDNRINASYAFGGMPLLDETIRKNFGIEIDANVEVDFDGFIAIIDRLGGVDISLKDYEVNYYNRQGHNYSVGVNHLSGGEALMYARTRYVGRSDFERTQRQRTIVTTVFNMVKNEDPVTIYKLINELFPYLTTDMSNSDIIYYAGLVLGMNINEIQSYRIPADGTYTDQTIRGMMVLVPDLSACRAELRRIIYGE